MRRIRWSVLVLWASFGWSQATVYKVTIPEPEHHWLQVEATFSAVGTKPLNLHMSRSSPGRYSVHEFSKNVFSLEATDGKGRKLAATRPSPYEWNVAGHDGTIHVVYKLFGDYTDGTYLGVDTTHAHMNMPATFVWADGLDDRAASFTFVPPAGTSWKVATQLYPTSDPYTFTAPNLQYFMDSPTEMSNFLMSTFSVPNSDGTPANFRVTVHATDASQEDVDELAKLVQQVVAEHMKVFGEFPKYEPGYYTFLLDYVPWSHGDGMEHRNSTCITGGASLKTPQGRLRALGTISHEFFHNWNMERIRPAGLEPFDFSRANISCCLWVGEGFTQYYGPLLLYRAGLSERPPVNPPNQVIGGSGRLVHNAVEMSEYAPFADGARFVDITDRSRVFISYYTYGAAIALALDLSLREKSNGAPSLDDYMRLLWKTYGKPGGPAPGLVGKPYTLKDLRERLAELTHDRAFADNFFDKYVEGREVADYARLFLLAGYVVRPVSPDRGWIGVSGQQMVGSSEGLAVGAPDRSGSVSVVPFGTPLYDAGVDEGDVITTIDGAPATIALWTAISQKKPGDKVMLGVKRRDGAVVQALVTLKSDPTLQSTLVENPTDAQKKFRDAWLGTRAGQAK